MSTYRKGTIIIDDMWYSDAFEKFYIISDERQLDNGTVEFDLVFLKQTLRLHSPYQRLVDIVEHRDEIFKLVTHYPDHGLSRFDTQKPITRTKHALEVSSKYKTLEQYESMLRYTSVPQDVIDGLKEIENKLYSLLYLSSPDIPSHSL